MKGRFHAVWEAEWTERGNTLNLWACECVLPCCVSLCNPECVEVLGWATERCQMFFVWSRGGISSRTMQGSNPCFSIPSSFSLHPSFPARWRGSFSFCRCFCIYNCERKLNHNERETDLDWRRLSESIEGICKWKDNKMLSHYGSDNSRQPQFVDCRWESLTDPCLAPLALVSVR